MAAWFADHVLGGLVVAVLVGASHARLWQRIKKLTAEQTGEIKNTRGDDHDGPALPLRR